MPRITKAQLEEENQRLKDYNNRLVREQTLLYKEIEFLTNFTKNLNNLHHSMTMGGEKLTEALTQTIVTLSGMSDKVWKEIKWRMRE